MRYQGSEAYDMDAAERGRERLYREERPSFEVVSGGGLDARARRGVSPRFVARLRAVVIVACALLVLGAARVALTSATVAVLQETSEIKTQISDARALNDELKIERSVLSSNSRISRIATQNYGMTLPTDRVTVSVESGDEAGAATSGDAAQATSEAGAQTPLS